jgi:hypothetical protein
MTSAVREPAIDGALGERGGGMSRPVTADAAASEIHSSVIAKNTIITPCSTVMFEKLTMPSISNTP